MQYGNDGPTERAATLQAAEVDDFLRFLFFDIARRPAALKMSECVRVARYLNWPAQAGVPKQIMRKGPRAVLDYRMRNASAEERDKKWCVQQIADVVWGRVRKMKAHEAAPNRQALSFLQAQADTHFANPYIGRALELIAEFDVPAADMRPTPKASLVSRSVTA